MGSETSHHYDWENGFTVDFDLQSGLSRSAEATARHLSQMRGLFGDRSAWQQMVNESNPVVYRFYEMGCPEDAGDVAFGTSITYPGKVGDEYYFTKGHFHTVIDTGEIYYCLSGAGLMLIENPEGDWHALSLQAGQATYVPKRYAHRTVNTGNEPLVTFFAFRGDAGHNYGTIESTGFRKMVVERDGQPMIIDNPNWLK